MRRAVNELTCDEVKRGTGVKAGDFGMGSRTYTTTRVKRQGGSSDQNSRNWIFVAVAFCYLGLFSYTEYGVFKLGTITREAKSSVQPIGNCLSESSCRSSPLVHAKSNPGFPPTLNALPTDKVTEGGFFYRGETILSPVEDPLLGVQAGARDVTMKRVTEYCQWMETEHRREYDRGDNVTVTETSYTYHKAWRSHKISSLFFDSPIAYHNPTRDPAPSSEFISERTIDLSGGQTPTSAYAPTVAVIDIAHAEPGALDDWKSLPLGIPSSDQLTASPKNQALNLGFSEVSKTHIYSRVPKDGVDNPLVKAAAAYLLDGTVDVEALSDATGLHGAMGGLGWLTKGTCSAGDVRVGYQSRALGSEITVVGSVQKDKSIGPQKQNLIVPHRYSDGSVVLFAMNKIIEISPLLSAVTYNKRWWATVTYLTLYLMFGATAFVTQCASQALIAIITGGLGCTSAAFSYYHGRVETIVTVVWALLLAGGLFFLDPKKNSGKTQEEEDRKSD